MIRYIYPAAVLSGLLAALTPLGGALGQVDTRSTAPIDITADQGEVDNSQCLAVWRGAAEALQGDTRLRADSISVYSHSKKDAGSNGQPACGGTDKIVAEGHVYYVTPQQHVRGDRAVYTEANDEIVVTGDVIVVQGDDVARGEKLTIDTNTHIARMEGQATGAGQPGRVRGVFYPDKNTTAGQPGATTRTTPPATAPSPP
jgi:lipopolysaccharide export system protein LptA